MSYDQPYSGEGQMLYPETVMIDEFVVFLHSNQLVIVEKNRNAYQLD